jgi:hypothetical protein
MNANIALPRIKTWVGVAQKVGPSPAEATQPGWARDTLMQSELGSSQGIEPPRARTAAQQRG